MEMWVDLEGVREVEQIWSKYTAQRTNKKTQKRHWLLTWTRPQGSRQQHQRLTSWPSFGVSALFSLKVWRLSHCPSSFLLSHLGAPEQGSLLKKASLHAGAELLLWEPDCPLKRRRTSSDHHAEAELGQFSSRPALDQYCLIMQTCWPLPQVFLHLKPNHLCILPNRTVLSPLSQLFTVKWWTWC